jgi:hypothetical protein
MMKTTATFDAVPNPNQMIRIGASATMGAA